MATYISDELREAPVQTLEGEAVELGSLFGERLTVLVFLRHYG